jgi:hypothetical protein
MEQRKFAIPAIALGFTALTLTGCLIDDDKEEDEDEEEEDTDGDATGIDGSWSLESLGYYGESYPMEYTYEYNGYTYTSSFSLTMNVASPSVDMVSTNSYYTDNPEYSYYNGGDSYTYSGTITDNGGTYSIAVTDFVNMDCTLSGSSLSCVGTGDQTGLELAFGRL